MTKLLAGMALATMMLTCETARATTYVQYVTEVSGTVNGPFLAEPSATFFGRIVVTLSDVQTYLGSSFVPCTDVTLCQVSIGADYLQVSTSSDSRYPVYSLRLNFSQAANTTFGVPVYDPATLSSGTYSYSPPANCARYNLADPTCGFRTATSVRLLSSTVSSAPFSEAIGVAVNISVVPEPASWALMIMGFGLIGTGMRQRRAQITYEV